MSAFFAIFKYNFFFLIISLLLNIKLIDTACPNGVTITDTNCFNNLIIIQKYYRAAQFATNKEGNMIIEYSNDESGRDGYRLFYGLKKDGRHYFEDDNPIKIINLTPSGGHRGRYESRNLFVSTEDDIDKNKQYLFSTSSYESLTELHDMEEGTHSVTDTIPLWNIIDIFSYQYSLLEIQKDNKNIYFCVFTQHETYQIEITYDDGHKEWKDHSRTFTIKKYKFGSSNLEDFNEMFSLNNTNNFNNRIISSFIIEDAELLVVFYMKRVDTNNQIAQYAFIFYDYNLNQKNEKLLSGNDIEDPRAGEGIFFKGLSLKNNYASFIYYTKGLGTTKIKFEISSLVLNSGNYEFNNNLHFEKEYGYISDIVLNEFIKINDERLAFISTKKVSSKYELHILLYDIYNSYSQVKIRPYYFDLDIYQLKKELTAYVFNGFLIFSSTAVTPVSDSNNEFFSILVFFGYPNGTDHEIDISPYLMDVDGYSNTNNIYNYLMSNMIIENNIFNYEPVDKINLVSIPEELLFYNITGGVQDTEPLPNNTFFGVNHKLYQNKQLNKTSRYYYIYYQYLVKEPSYDTFYPSGIINDIPSTFDASGTYNANRKTFYGRTNRIKFKLCYEYCGSCIEFGKTINKQECLTCLEDYTYDYWAYLGKYIANCVPENKYYDFDNHLMVNCESSFKFLNDNQNHKRICFKDNEECPLQYSNYNYTTNECEYTPIPTIITTQILPIITNQETTFSPKCTFDSYYNNECNFLDYSESQVLSQVRDLIYSYPNKKNKNLFIYLPQGFGLEMSNDKKELLFMNDTELPWLDLGQCGEKLRAKYRNDSNFTEPLIILKYGLISDVPSEKYLQYEVYDPDTFKKLNLSICENSDVHLYINVPLSDELTNILKNIIDQGYDPFDINDKFYREICTPYDSENGTDVLLDSREEYYYSSLKNLTCPENCHTSSYDLDSKYLKCECEVNDNDITLNLKHITGENIGNSFYSTLKNSNWKVMICYNLVFNLKVFAHNYGSIIALIFFIIYLGFIVFLLFKGIQPLQVIISKIMFQENKPDKDVDKKNNNTASENSLSKGKKKRKKVTYKNPPKKDNSRKGNKKVNFAKDSDNTKIVSFNEAKSFKSEKLMTNPGKTKNDKFKNKFQKEFTYTEVAQLKKKKEKQKEEKVDEEIILNLDDFQLNNLEYNDAVKYDKRPFLNIYWSVLMREHVLLFTFFAWNDYNLFYIKIERFLLLICTQMAMNGLFFTDESMHKANNTEGYNFVQQLPKIIFSLIATHVIEVILCFFSMTDTTIYKIKELAKIKQNEEAIFKEIKCMKRKIIGFYVFTFLLFLFYWYFISAFCAVYQNTQKTFLLDSLFSILIGYIDPFFIYCFTTLLRYLSLAKCANNNLDFLYKTSDLIPIF